PGARVAEQVRFEDALRRAAHVFGRDLADESRNVDAGRTGGDAGSVVAVEAAIGLGDRLPRRVRRLGVGKPELEPVRGHGVSHFGRVHRNSPLARVCSWQRAARLRSIAGSTSGISPPSPRLAHATRARASHGFPSFTLTPWSTRPARSSLSAQSRYRASIRACRPASHTRNGSSPSIQPISSAVAPRIRNTICPPRLIASTSANVTRMARNASSAASPSFMPQTIAWNEAPGDAPSCARAYSFPLAQPAIAAFSSG